MPLFLFCLSFISLNISFAVSNMSICFFCLSPQTSVSFVFIKHLLNSKMKLKNHIQPCLKKEEYILILMTMLLFVQEKIWKRRVKKKKIKRQSTRTSHSENCRDSAKICSPTFWPIYDIERKVHCFFQRSRNPSFV